jgi:hypothetical protein
MTRPSIRRTISGVILAAIALAMSGCVVYPEGGYYDHPHHYWYR